MKKLGCTLLVLILALVLVAGLVWPTVRDQSNALNPTRQEADAAWGEVQANYQRRSDLIPQLVQTVQGAASFEKSTFVEVSEARASVGKVTISQDKAPTDAAQLEKYEQAQGQITAALSHLMSVQEKYPELKANQNFLNLQATIEGTENRILQARRLFNKAVQKYDTQRNVVPLRFYANFLGYEYLPYFHADEQAQHAPTVSFDFNKKS